MKRRFRILRWLLLPAALIIVLLVADRLSPLPLQQVEPARVVVAEDGTPLWRFADRNGIWRYPVTLDDVSPLYLEALLTYEDRWFWQHPGINPLAILRAAWQDIRGGGIISGGSTLTMQVARLIDPQPRNWRGKLLQVWRALQLEWHLSKSEILTLYLNRAPFGGTIEGIGAASWTWLGKSPAQMTRSEAALMAVLPQAPSRLRPDRWPLRAQAARNKVLQRMIDYQVWPKQQVDELFAEPVWLAPRQMPELAPLLARRLLTVSPQQKVTSTINASLQRQLEALATGWKNQLPPRTSLAFLVVDHTTMKVRGYLGSIDLNDDNRFGHVDMISSVRSPGSILKPFVYGLAIDDGLIHAESLLQDVPRRFGDYRPGNFDSGFHGPVSASEALSRSLNLPAVQLLDAYGPKRFAAALRNTGINLRFPAAVEPNLSLVLGGTGTRMDEVVSAYSAFARQGNVAALRFLPGQKLEERRLLSPGAAWVIRRILAGEAQPQSGGDGSAIVPLAWKTGTSYGYRDAWAVGVDARYLIGVWVGRPDGTPVAGQYGYASAVPVLNQVHHLLMSSPGFRGPVLPGDPRPASVSAATICWPGGQSLAPGDSNCRQRRQSWIVNNTVPPTLLAPGQEGVSGLQQPIWLNSQGLRVASDCSGAQAQTLMLWPLPLEPWLPQAERRASRLPAIDTHCPPLSAGNTVPLILTGLRDSQILHRLPGQQRLAITVSVQGGQGNQRWWFLNGSPLEDQSGAQSQALSFEKPGAYQLTILDEGGQVATASFTVE
ncbi:peptidoglycan glycosyltransferase PbpC [Erwiniaceae bacterium BAC15a-03b]|uniref:peptidoglycan glycosyltransferase n=1 Tax=Winslowiella arboricola TaxID=2978220 RepID=A0A9J6PG83_9GAMM|nr:peptidoglycan glycosyltransferase PbpC [Winslowiella arboricola]MCU5773960.1 peptidoglycan glycosyltransferase PbpC [Winslowiella arboricola]MCU5777313.1 peptidoglycan glycosyltransferase PbpC [Winslowiella arboricola]